MSRRSKYTPSLLKRARKYIKDGYIEQGDQMPMQSGLAVYLDIHKETVRAWSQDESKPEFVDLIDRLMALQELALMNNGLTGKFNPNIAKLALAKHGYVEKSETDNKHAHSGDVNLNFVGVNNDAPG